MSTIIIAINAIYCTKFGIVLYILYAKCPFSISSVSVILVFRLLLLLVFSNSIIIFSIAFFSSMSIFKSYELVLGNISASCSINNCPPFLSYTGAFTVPLNSSSKFCTTKTIDDNFELSLEKLYSLSITVPCSSELHWSFNISF